MGAMWECCSIGHRSDIVEEEEGRWLVVVDCKSWSIHRMAPNEVELKVHNLILNRVCFPPKDSICG